MLQINKPAPEFQEDALINNSIKKISLKDFKGKWVILFFYPGDFTFVCPTELRELAKCYELFKQENAEIISVSVDSVFVHKAWKNTSETIKNIPFPMLADPSHRVSKAYGTLIEEEGISLRATFLIDPNGIIKAFEYHDNSIGRSVDEILRKLQAAKYVQIHSDQVCPMNWKPGNETLKPSLDLVGKI